MVVFGSAVFDCFYVLVIRSAVLLVQFGDCGIIPFLTRGPGISSWCGLRLEFHLCSHMLYSLGPLWMQLDHIMHISFREVVSHACLGYHHGVVSDWSSTFLATCFIP